MVSIQATRTGFPRGCGGGGIVFRFLVLFGLVVIQAFVPSRGLVPNMTDILMRFVLCWVMITLP